MFTEKDFWDYFSEETIIIDLVSTQKPEELESSPTFLNSAYKSGTALNPQL
jgi:hypothetical protein